ncbi:MAG: L-threonylcarbamoyladenylate synthase, partial [Alphaproteobacteria bacterium]|nr:L-threonylcarbamoyladenylate synthase [Alphaproteobacteria bacterium]
MATILSNTAENISLCVQKLQDGEIVAIPTDTVYGLVANAYNSEAIAKIYQYKNRPADKPLAWLLHSIKQVEELFVVNDTFYALAEKSLGGLTLILNSKETGIKQGFRIPNNKVCLNLLEKLNIPLA